jgi:hypothetical protein
MSIRIAVTEAFRVQASPNTKSQVANLIDNSLGFIKEEQRLRKSGGVGEAVRDQTALIHGTPAGLKSPSHSQPSQSLLQLRIKMKWSLGDSNP